MTSIDSDRTRRIEKEWKEALAGAIDTWLETHNLTKTKAAEMFGIPPHVLTPISLASSVSEWEHGEAYARIYLLMGLEEADPRTIPPRLCKIPSGSWTERNRAWSGRQLEVWRDRNASLLSQHGVTLKPNQPKDVIPTTQGQPSAGQILEELISAIGAEIADIVLQEVIRNQPKPSLDKADVGHLATLLTQMLQAYADGSTADRDRLMQKHGRVLTQLLPLVDLLTNPNPKEREEGLSLGRMVSR